MNIQFNYCRYFLKKIKNSVDKWKIGLYTQFRCCGSAKTTKQLLIRLKKFLKKLLTDTDKV